MPCPPHANSNRDDDGGDPCYPGLGRRGSGLQSTSARWTRGRSDKRRVIRQTPFAIGKDFIGLTEQAHHVGIRALGGAHREPLCVGRSDVLRGSVGIDAEYLIQSLLHVGQPLVVCCRYAHLRSWGDPVSSDLYPPITAVQDK